MILYSYQPFQNKLRQSQQLIFGASMSLHLSASIPTYRLMTARHSHRAQLCEGQRADPTFVECFTKVVSNGKSSDHQRGKLLSEEWSAVHQIVVPVGYQQHMLMVAHHSDWQTESSDSAGSSASNYSDGWGIRGSNNRLCFVFYLQTTSHSSD